jgi:UDPglucose--hexose-1-phosphate uridylyltransferase
LPELRIDPLSGLRVIVAGERGDRPAAFLPAEDRPPLDPDDDPLAEGHEQETPPELYAVRPGGGARDGRGWRVRVVPNRYPALVGEAVEGAGGGLAAGQLAATCDRPAGSWASGAGGGGAGSAGAGAGRPRSAAGDDPLGAGRGEPDLFAARPATGAHEVIVHAPEPVSSLLDLTPEAVEDAMAAWRERMRAHRDAAYVHVFVNEGRAAGASLAHTHAQLYALPFVPSAIARERERFTAYSDRTQGRNLLADLLQEEVRRRERIVAVDAEAVALCPFASRMPFQLQVVPRRPARSFEDDGPLGARLLHESLRRLAAALGRLPPLNLWVRTAPRGAERFCWRIDVLPRLAQLAGLEVGTGVHLNVVPPERAARELRAAAL